MIPQFIFNIAFMVEFQDLQIGNVIGRGSFATVNRGKWQGKDVALKRIKIPPGYDDTADITNSQEIAILRSGY